MTEQNQHTRTDELAEYVSRALNRPRPRSVKAYGGGWSDLTYRVTWEDAAVAVRLRRSEGILRSLVLDVQAQHDLLSVVGARGVAVPAALHSAPTSPLDDMPILITDWVQGYSPVAWSPEAREFFERVGDSRGGRSFTEQLAAIHSVTSADLVDFPHASQALAARSTLAELTEYQRLAEFEVAGNYAPLVQDAVFWLVDGMPRVADRDIRLVHGDYQTGNIVFDEESGDIRAVLDWELARLEDFHYDLGWIASRLNRVGSDRWAFLVRPDAFLQQYQELTGNVVDQERLTYWIRFQHLRHMMMFISAPESATKDLRLVRGRANLSRLALMLAEAFGY